MNIQDAKVAKAGDVELFYTDDQIVVKKVNERKTYACRNFQMRDSGNNSICLSTKSYFN